MKWTCSKCGNYRECTSIDGKPVCVSCDKSLGFGLDVLSRMMGMGK